MQVTLYSTPTCPWCRKAKQYLDEKKVAYVVVDVSTDAKALDQIIKKTGQMGVPVLEIKGNIIIGFDPIAIDEALL